MKLLGWMHRKLRQQSREGLINFTGNPSSCYSARTLIDEQLFHAEPALTLAQSREPSRKCPELLSKMKETGMEERLEEESNDELFHGFLAIGTLGSELLGTEPPTPTFPMSFQNLTNKEIYITENEVKLINNELEKFLVAEAKEFIDDSSERSSQESIINFGNEQLDNANSEDGGRYSATCPLQKYLFGNLIELPVIAAGQKKETMSLEELFSISDRCSENSVKKHDSPEKLHKESYAKRFMKNILKKVHSTATSCIAASSASNAKPTKSGAIKRKLPKVLKPKFLHRKLHPEGLISEKLITANKDEITKISVMSEIPDAEDQERKSSPKKGTMKKEIINSAYSERINSHSTTANGERWIKTDDDYLVLEL